MKQEASAVASMQDDLRQWDYEYLSWRADIEQWRRQHESALSALAMLQELIRQHGAALQSHAEMLEQDQQNLRDHGRAMSEYQSLGSERLSERLAEVHREHVRCHKKQQTAHARIKHHHHDVMAHLKLLKVAIEAGM